MSQQTLVNRISQWFRGGKNEGDLPIMREISPDQSPPHGGQSQMVKTSVLRPWARRENEMSARLTEGFQTLTELMSSVRDSLERQASRQDQLIEHLSHLPEALQSTADSSRLQTETLKAIHVQMSNQGEQTKQLAGILEKMNDVGGNQQEILESLRERVEAINQQDKYVSDTLHGVGNALQAVSQSSQSSTEVLKQMRSDSGSRDEKLEMILRKQATRFTTMLAIAVFLSVAALTAVVVMGYLMLKK